MSVMTASRRLWGIVVVMVVIGLVLSSRALAAGDANMTTCPASTEGPGEASPGFRTYLPDCRGYDMASPPYKGGSPLFQLSAISENGEHLVVNSWGGFAGTGNNENTILSTGAGTYELSRSGDMWSAEPLEPPGTEVSHGIYTAASSDLSRTLWELIEEPVPPETELLNALTRYKLAIRVHEPGSPARFDDVGPEDNPNETFDKRNFAIGGASSDLSHVVYSIEENNTSPTWPGDQTENGRESLYEYAGLKNSEPTLVGVKNAGAPPWQAGATHINEGAQLISACGTVLGSKQSAYNAISTNGDIVFFTAAAGFSGPCPEVNELYARVNGEGVLAISEPPLTAPGRTCTGTCKEDENQENGHERKEGVFQGASADGSKVFFTTEQPLLNEDEDESNDLYMEEIGCPVGKEGCKTVEKEVTKLVQVSHDPNVPEAAGVMGVARISENGGRVYFVANGVLTTEPNQEGKSPTSGERNLYVYEPDAAHAGASHVVFVATLSTADESNWKASDNRRSSQATPNGRFLIFVSEADLTGDDTSTAAQLFEYDAEAERLTRVSIGQCPTGKSSCAAGERFNGNGNISEYSLVPMIRTPVFEGHDDPTEAVSTLSLSADGRVFFASLDALTPGAVEGATNIYEYSAANVYLIAAGEDPTLELSAFGEVEPPFVKIGRLVSTDEAGTDVFFGAVGQLVPQDTDTQADIYDARVGGGTPLLGAASSCSGEACRGAASIAPQLGSAGSATQAAGDNLAPAPVAEKRGLTPAQKLKKALTACRKKRNQKKRRVCEADARRHYAAKASAKQSKRGGK